MENEKKRHLVREQLYQRTKFIENNLPALEAI